MSSPDRSAAQGRQIRLVVEGQVAAVFVPSLMRPGEDLTVWRVRLTDGRIISGYIEARDEGEFPALVPPEEWDV